MEADTDTYFILLPQEAEDAWHLVSDVERCSLTAVAGLAALGPKKMQSKAWKKGCCGVRLGVQDVDTYCQRRLPIPKQVLSRVRLTSASRKNLHMPVLYK